MTQSLYFNQRHSPVAILSLLVPLLIMHIFYIFSPSGLQVQVVCIACCACRAWTLVCAVP